MSDDKTKQQLAEELAVLRERAAKMETAEAERKRAEDLTGKARELAESIVDTVREPLLVLDAKLRVISASRSFCQTFHVTQEESEGQLLYDLGNGQWNIPALRVLLEEILPQNTRMDDFKVKHEFEDIGERFMLLNARRIYRAGNDTETILLAIEDITERKQAEGELEKYREHLEELVEERTEQLRKTNQQIRDEISERKKAQENLQEAYKCLEKQSLVLAQTEKMSAIGTLVAGTAHELNNPMMGILNFATHCIKHTSEDDRLYTVLQDIEHKAKRCTEIVRNLLTFSHAEQDDDKAYQKESLAEILGRVLKLLSYRIEKQRISVTQHITEDTPEIWMKPNSIQQLILNLATNALDALEGSEKKELNVDIHRKDEFVEMTFADTGCGIAAESLGSVFDPFFTTKPVGKGTGLGLSVAQGIIKAHGGQISCESEPGAGTKFIILLPIERSKQNEQANTCN